MDTHNQLAYMIGLAAGFLVVFLLLFFVTRKKNKRAEYDERQILARGRAYKSGFFTLLLYFFWYTTVSALDIELFRRYNIPIAFAGIIFSIAVFAVTAIKNDAYLGLHEKSGTQTALLALLTVANTASGIGNYIKDAESGLFLMNALCTLLGIVILAALLIHQKRACNEENAE